MEGDDRRRRSHVAVSTVQGGALGPEPLVKDSSPSEATPPLPKQLNTFRYLTVNFVRNFLHKFLTSEYAGNGESQLARYTLTDAG